MEDVGSLGRGHSRVDRGNAFGDGTWVDAGCIHGQVMVKLTVENNACAAKCVIGQYVLLDAVVRIHRHTNEAAEDLHERRDGIGNRHGLGFSMRLNWARCDELSLLLFDPDSRATNVFCEVVPACVILRLRADMMNEFLGTLTDPYTV